MSEKPAYNYDIYIGAPVGKVWKGIVDGEMTKHYVYGTRLESKLKKGAPFAYVGDGGFRVVDGEILEIEPDKRLVMSWNAHWDDSVARDRPSRITKSPDGETVAAWGVGDRWRAAGSCARTAAARTAAT